MPVHIAVDVHARPNSFSGGSWSIDLEQNEIYAYTTQRGAIKLRITETELRVALPAGAVVEPPLTRVGTRYARVDLLALPTDKMTKIVTVPPEKKSEITTQTAISARWFVRN